MTPLRTTSWFSLLAMIVVLVLKPGVSGVVAAGRPNLVFSCRADNDLYRVMTAVGTTYPRYETPLEAIRAAVSGSGVLILADGYPQNTTDIEPAVYDQAAKKKIRLYVEYPSSVPGVEVGPPRTTRWHRGVVSSDLFAPHLKRLRILGIHDCHFQPVKAKAAHLVLAKVAGLDTAVYGLEGTEAHPILFEHPRGDMLVATTKLSQFVTARYSPSDAWGPIWQTLLRWLQPGKTIAPLVWTPTVRPSYDRDEKLPDDAELQAFRRGTDWFINGNMLVSKPKKPDSCWAEAAPPCKTPRSTDAGRYGLREGYRSLIRVDGSQPMAGGLRTDCIGESTMAFALRSVVEGERAAAETARNLNDYIYFHSLAARGPRAQPESPSFGLLGWTTCLPHCNTYYGDDNARSMLGTMAAAAVLKSNRWDEGLIRCLLGNLRTAGRYGFRGSSLNEKGLQQLGWQHYFKQPKVFYGPHYEAYLWACYLWAYRQTGFEPFRDAAKTAIRMQMQVYPDQWRWTNGIQQERARMLLPLAWLVRVEDTPQHRRWLRQMGREIRDDQDASGAIREELGPEGHGSLVPPRSNADYGKHEASLLQTDGDPISDLLYTTNFALLGLHEAARATEDPLFVDMENRLVQFLCRIQVRSEAHPELDGAWFRAFDFKRWEYWASNADAGWGVWSIESGWTQSWIVGVLAMRLMNTSLWDLTAESNVEKHFHKWRRQMLPDDVLQAAEADRVSHAAMSRPVKLAGAADPRYPGTGPQGLTDGVFGGTTLGHECLGFEGTDLDAVVDLEEPRAIVSLAAGFRQSVPVGVFLPKEVELAVSDDGKTFRTVARLKPPISPREKGPLNYRFVADRLDVRGRYVRVHATNLGVIPDWHPAKGRKAWLFADEIMVNAKPQRQ